MFLNKERKHTEENKGEPSILPDKITAYVHLDMIRSSQFHVQSYTYIL